MIEPNYKTSGDYLIPDVMIEPQEVMPLGKYGRMHREYLRQNRPTLFNRLLLKGTLNAHLSEIEQTAQRRLDELMTKLAAQSGVTEELKAKDPMLWVGMMNSLKSQAEEIILTELVYS